MVLAFIPIIAFSYIVIWRPLLGHLDTPVVGLKGVEALMVPDWKNKTFWPIVLATTLLLAIVGRSSLVVSRLRSPSIAGLAAYLLLSGASIVWAYSPDYSFSRFALELMIVTTIILPCTVASSATDTVRSVYGCYVLSLLINVFFVINYKPMLTGTGEVLGHFGYFSFKQYLGECAAVGLLLSFHEMLFAGRRRYFAALVIPVCIWLLFASNSKGALAFVLFAPALAGMTMFVSSKTRLPMVVILLIIPLSYVAVEIFKPDLTNRISYMLFGDSTLTSRTVIWDFIQNQISRKPWLGWGFHSFWLVGPNAPSVVEAPYWIRHMTGSHNGYLDVRLETGYIGLAVFLLFLVGVLYAMERVRQQDPVRAWLLLSLALYVIVTNFLETVWLVTDEPLWFLFLLVVGETARYSRSARQVGAPTNDHTGLRRLGSVRKCHLSPIASGGYRRLRA